MRTAHRRRRRADVSILAIAFLFLLLVSTVRAEGPLDHLHFDRGADASGAPEFRLGTNAFSAEQLVDFLASIERFLLLADDLEDGERVTLRQEGRRGYIALTAYDTDAAPRYVLTLAAHEPTGIASRSGLEALWVTLAEQLEPVASAEEISFAAP